jgi:hypothetical protein
LSIDRQTRGHTCSKKTFRGWQTGILREQRGWQKCIWHPDREAGCEAGVNILGKQIDTRQADCEGREKDRQIQTNRQAEKRAREQADWEGREKDRQL